MKKTISPIIVVAVVFGMLAAYMPMLAQSSHADISSWQKGASVYPNSPTDFQSQNFKDSLQELKATGANYITLVVPYYQSGFSTADIGNGSNTPTDAALAAGIDYAHSIGLRVMLKVHDDVPGGGWRGFINPQGATRTQWFANYGAMVNKLGDLAQAHGVEEICIGTELRDMSMYTFDPTNTQNWMKLIQNVRSHFKGALTYDANWGSGPDYTEANNIAFWGGLDYIGISGYYELDADSADSVASLVKSWVHWDKDFVTPLYTKYQKPILFSEVGYRSISGAHGQPWNYNLSGSPSQTEQANDYQALFQYWSTKSYFAGVQIWDWNVNKNAGNPNDIEYSPQNKLAETIMKTWFSQNVTGANGGSTASAWSVKSSGSINQTGTPSTLNLSVTSVNQTADMIIDAEIYDASGNKVYQQFFEHQNFTTNQTNPYQISWTPQNAGTYTIRLGVFTTNWTNNVYWNSAVMSFAVIQASTGPVIPPIIPPTGTTTPPTGTSTPPIVPPTSTSTPPVITPPQTFETNIWWPTDGAAVQSVQPFKAMVIGKSISDYTMFWQVDGGTLNMMQDNQTDYPHKETLVDVSNWHWQPSGNYTINFVSKDSSGSVISQKSIMIKVQ